MAEAVVGLLIGKIGAALATEAATYGASLLCKEASALKGLFGEIRKAKDELESMRGYLRDAEKFKETNETSGIFVKRIRNLAFRIEDVVDEFTYKLEDKHGGFVVKMKKRINQVKTWHCLAVELGSINAELKEAVERRNRYAISENDGGSDHHGMSTHQISTFAREEDLVGIEDKAQHLKQWLVSDLGERKHKIVSVWGMGGAGKTTLVEHVYKHVKDDFDVAIWVTVSRSYLVEDLLKKIGRGLGITKDISNMEQRSLVEAICNHLNGRKYIIVLDDVWETNVWINIRNVFPVCCISRFVLTSRHKDVASLATSSDCIMELKVLKEKYSWKLFCNAAFRENNDKVCPPELWALASKFLEKCEGLPLAITCIGNLLSFKPPTLSEWKKVYDDLELQSTKHIIPGVDMILKVSLEDLPYELKNCFLYCALFPEDFIVNRRRLIRHWITDGFIREKRDNTLEEVAERYLNELVNRSLLQVVQRNDYGRVKYCRMHDIIRHISLKKAEDEGFGKIYDGSATFSVDSTRRLSIESTNIEPLNQPSAKHIRAIHAFTNSIDIDLLRPILSSSNLLSTLDLQGTDIKMLPDVVFSLFNLRYLGLRYSCIEVLPEAIGRLVNLEVLDAFRTKLLSLPKGVSKLKKIRYLYAVAMGQIGTFPTGIEMPRGIRNLTELQALQAVKASSEILCDVAALCDLRTLAVSNVKSQHSLNLCNAITNMKHLVHLTISAQDEHEVLPLEALPLPATLSKLDLEGKLEKKHLPQILSSWSHLVILTELVLGFSNIDEESFSCLAVLRGLCSLYLTKAYNGKKLYFPAESFPRLRILFIWTAPQLNQVEVEEGALTSLVKLWLQKCPELKSLPRGIENLSALEELRLEDTAEELIVTLMQKRDEHECNKELMKISHIEKVIVVLTEKNMWKRIR